jgi:hypothetical protein
MLQAEMLMVVCPVTLQVVECGPNGMGWEMTQAKQWVKKWGPAILASLCVLKAAVVAGRVLGLPLPVPDMSSLHIPGAYTFEKELALQTIDKISEVLSLDNIASEMHETMENVELESKLAGPGKEPVLSEKCHKLVGEAYAAIVTFLTTGSNALLGPLEGS